MHCKSQQENLGKMRSKFLQLWKDSSRSYCAVENIEYEKFSDFQSMCETSESSAGGSMAWMEREIFRVE